MARENKTMEKDYPTVEGRLYANWDSYWDGFMTNPLIESVRFRLVTGACQRLLKTFPKKENLSFCELGAGTSVISRFLGDKFQANISIVDSNPKALAISQKTFDGYPQQYTQIHRDVFDLKEYAGQFDLVHSGGLIEHFVDGMRNEIVRAHCDLVKGDGHLMLLVPTHNFLYRILNEGIFKAMHLLDEIKEVPWSYDELEQSLKDFGFKIVARTTVVTELGVLARRI